MAENLCTLVTGASGFVGRYLCATLARADHSTHLVGCGEHSEPSWAAGLGMGWARCNVLDITQCRHLLDQHRPKLIFHLAALSHVPTSFQQPAETWLTNTLGTLHLLEALRAAGRHCGFVFIGSGDIYGRSFQAHRPLDETALPQPTNPYAASKAAADLLVQQYGAQGMPTVSLRPFNHIGPGQRPDFVVASFARQIARIERGLQEPLITVGDLAPYRDFTDVRDIARAYALVGARLDELQPGSVFNVCSGTSRRIGSVLEELLEMSRVPIEIRQDQDKMRSSDTPFAAGDAGRLRHATAWDPEIPWERTLQDVLADWRERAS